MKKILCMLLCLLMLIPTLASCSKPPEYAEIEARLRELCEASADINQMFFGEGLATYERVYDPQADMKYVDRPDSSDPQKTVRTYYYTLEDPTYGTVVAFRSSYLSPYAYVQVTSEADPARTAYYVSEDGKSYCYLLEDYTEPTYELFYDDSDPYDYDYVRDDAPYLSVSEMKAAAEQVYSKEYLETIYNGLFVGTVSEVENLSGLSARYMEFADEDGTIRLMKSNTQQPLIHEVRQFRFDTAQIIKPSNRNFVTVELDSFLPSAPDTILKARLTLILQDGVWMLDSATY